MRTKRILLAASGFLSLLMLRSLAVGFPAKEKVQPVSPNDPTLKLFQLLDTSYEGKLDELCIIGDVFKDPKDPTVDHQEILRVEYDKNRGFGKLQICVRVVDKLTADQLKTYTPKQIYDFGQVDAEKFTKTDPGTFGKPGDIYFRSQDGGPLASAPVSEDIQKAYDRLVTQNIIPALTKK